MDVTVSRILWPTDFSELSLKAGRYAHALAQHFAAQLHVVHVIPPVMTADFSVALPATMPVTATDPETIQACREGLQRIVTDRLQAGGNVVQEVLFGNPWSAICEYAEARGVELIVVSTHGRTGLTHIVIGSTAERIVQHAPCPVLTVKATERDFLAQHT
jgi:universal stress protein A